MDHLEDLDTFRNGSVKYKMARESFDPKITHSQSSMSRDSARLANGWVAEQEAIGGLSGFVKAKRPFVSGVFAVILGLLDHLAVDR